MRKKDSMKENAYLKKALLKERRKSREKDAHFLAMISDGLRCGSKLAGSYMADRRSYLNGK